MDDEPLAMEIIEDYVERTPGAQLLGKFTDSREALGFVKQTEIDIVFLDVEMPGVTGIEFVRLLEGRCAVVLTTAYPHYALDGFDLEVTDYLLKPIPFDRFERAVKKAMADPRFGISAQAVNGDPRSAADYVMVKTDQRIRKVGLEHICFIEGMKDYISIYTDQERIVTLQLMRKMEELLPADRFMRVHRSYIVAWQKITQIERSRLWIGDHVIPIGETYREAFFKKSLEHRI